MNIYDVWVAMVKSGEAADGRSNDLMKRERKIQGWIVGDDCDENWLSW